ncbi:MAG TPA: hypothetical protein P5550_03900, partial [Bacteroidales bacterium]|nr:hypothetical protein [Bacteroidales bacterium]
MQTLTVHANPVVTIIKDDTICLGESVTLQATGALTYLWGDGETTASIDVSPSTSMTYHVTGTDEHGCTATDDAHVMVRPLPILSVSADTGICAGDCASLMAYGTGSFSWSSGSSSASASVCPGATTTYV